MFMALLFNNPIDSSSMMNHRRCLEIAGNWDPECGNVDADGELILRFSGKELKPLAIHRATVFYRRHGQQLSHRLKKMGIEYSRLKNMEWLSDEDMVHVINRFFSYFVLLHLMRYKTYTPKVSSYLPNFIHSRRD
mgnify:CR=1 FL=1